MSDDDLGGLFSLPTALELKDAGIARVTENNATWMETALGLLCGMDHDHEATGEDIRLWLSARMDDEPAHHNAYGALICHAVRRGILTPTGAWVKMRTAKSHARRTPVYRVGMGKAC